MYVIGSLCSPLYAFILYSLSFPPSLNLSLSISLLHTHTHRACYFFSLFAVTRGFSTSNLAVQGKGGIEKTAC